MDNVTVAALIYKSASWLSLFLEGLAWARNVTPYRTLVVGNDANEEVMATGRMDLDFRNPDPTSHYLGRVYNAWNAAVEVSQTKYVVLLNSDMIVSDYWLDELMEIKRATPNALPCSLLVESGRIPSAMPEHVRNLGLTPDEFNGGAWRDYASAIRKRGATEPGRLYMPVLFEREAFLRCGGYPLGNPPGTTGDKFLFGKLQSAGLVHLTALGSVVYHVQEGEMRG